jgi:hypothetical protein
MNGMNTMKRTHQKAMGMFFSAGEGKDHAYPADFLMYGKGLFGGRAEVDSDDHYVYAIAL